MAIMKDVNQTAEESIDNLTQLLAVINQSESRIGAGVGVIDAFATDLNGCVNQVGEGYMGLTQTVMEGRTTIDTTDAEAVAKVEIFQQGITDFDSRKEVAIDTVAAVVDQVIGDIESSGSEIESRVSDLSTGIQEADTEFQQIHDRLEGAKQETTDALSELADAMEEMKEQFDGAKEEVAEQIESLGSEIADDITSDLESQFTEFADTLTDEQGEEMNNAFDDLKDGAAETFGEFDKLCEEIGDELKDRVAEIMENVSSHLQDDAKQQVEEALKTEAKECVDALLDEVLVEAQLMVIGSFITTSISPWLPQITVAKNAVETIKVISKG